MTVIKPLMFFVILSFLTGDAVVFGVCILKESCILPCSFQVGDELVIHWIRQSDGSTVHSYYNGQNQLQHQNQDFKGRTKLFVDQFSQGNASLQLQGVKIQDQGRYKCYTSTISDNKESINVISVEAVPPKVTVTIHGKNLTCSSEGLYPKPDLTWSSSPPSVPDNPTVHQNDERLYSISGSMIVKDNVSDVDYSCTISTGSYKRRATFFKLTSISYTDTTTTIPCTSLNIQPKSLIWKFNGEQIVNQNIINEAWKKHVKDVSESGSIILQGLTEDQEGIYTCELTTTDETYVSKTCLKVEEIKQISGNVAGIVAGVLIPLVVIIIICFGAGFWAFKRGYFNRFKKEKTNDATQREPQELAPLKPKGEARAIEEQNS